MQHNLVIKGQIHPFGTPSRDKTRSPCPAHPPTWGGARGAPVPRFRQENQGGKARGVLSLVTTPGFKGRLWAEWSP